MTPLQRRFKRIVGRFGEAFTVGATPGTGIFAPISSGFASVYLSDSERSAAARPIRVAYVAYDDTTAETATLAWDGLTLTVKRVVKVRFQGATVAKMLVLV